jgi:hypothetical protein
MWYGSGMAGTKQITIRMPLDVLGQLGAMPHGKSAPYIVEAVRERLERDRQAQIEAGFACLAHDDEANDISPFVEARDEVMARLD